MALIGKIREKTSLAVGLVAIGLVLFLVGSDLLGLGPRTASQHPVIGKVAGKKITLRSFQEQCEARQHGFFLQYDRMPTEVEKEFLRDQVWQQLLTDICYAQIHDALGITVTADELVDMVQGAHIHPDLRAAFIDPATQEFDKKRLLLYLERLAQMPAAQQAQWHSLEKRLATTRCNTKFNQLMERSAFVTDLAAQAKHQLAHTSLAIRYLYIPYSSLQVDSLRITDAMLKDYLKAHKNDYQVAESRGIRYVTFPIIPTEEDTIALQEELQTLKQAFTQAQDDSVFASMHTEGSPVSVYATFTQAQLPQALAQQGAALRQGMVIGPIEEGEKHKLYKIAAINGQAPRQYEVAMIEKTLTPGDEARDQAFRRADYFASIATNRKQFEAQATQDTLPVHQAQVGKNDSHVGVRAHAREIVRWLYSEATIGKISPVFELADEYVIAVMADQVHEGTASLNKVRDEITRQVIHELKAPIILGQLQAISDTTLDAMAAQYGEAATLLTAEQLKFSDHTLPGVGRARKAIGQAFALRPSKRSKPIADDKGVLVVELVERHEAAAPESLADYRRAQEQQEQFKQTDHILRSLAALAQVKDYRYKYY